MPLDFELGNGETFSRDPDKSEVGVDTIEEAWRNLSLGGEKSFGKVLSEMAEDSDSLSGEINTSSLTRKDIAGAENTETEVMGKNDGGGGKATSVLKPSPSVGVNLDTLSEEPIGGPSRTGGSENSSTGNMMDEAWELLTRAYVNFKGQRVGALAAINDESGGETLNYNQVFAFS